MNVETPRFFRAEQKPAPDGMESLVDAIEGMIKCRSGPIGRYFDDGKEYTYTLSVGRCILSNDEVSSLCKNGPLFFTEKDAVRGFWYHFNHHYSETVMDAVRPEDRSKCTLYWRELPYLEWTFGRAMVGARYYIDGPFRKVIRIGLAADDLRRATHPISIIDGGKE